MANGHKVRVYFVVEINIGFIPILGYTIHHDLA